MLTIPPSAHFGWPKMVINLVNTIYSFWLAKNGDKFFWEEKFNAANGKA
jgi:hypothetical protein